METVNKSRRKLFSLGGAVGLVVTAVAGAKAAQAADDVPVRVGDRIPMEWRGQPDTLIVTGVGWDYSYDPEHPTGPGVIISAGLQSMLDDWNKKMKGWQKPMTVPMNAFRLTVPQVRDIMRTGKY